MKKIFIILTVAVMTITAHAQWYVGGSLAFDYNKLNSESAKTYTLSIEPTLGFCINDKHAVELNIGYSRSYVNNVMGKSAENNYNIGSAYCYTIPILDELSYNVYGGGGVGFKDDGFNNYGVFAGNFLEYFISSNFSITAGFDIISFTRYKDNGIYNSNLNFAWNNPGFMFGVYFYF